MLPNPLLRKLVQISEEALPSVHVPLILGNDFFILTQQDVRKIEDTRLFSVSKLMPNGDIKPINTENAIDFMQQQTKQENLLAEHNFNSFIEFLINKVNCQQKCLQQPMPQPMETVASIEQQLQWNRCDKTSSVPYPLHYSQGTSTTDIKYKQQEIKDKENMSTCSCRKTCPECGNSKEFCNKSTVTKDLQEEVLDAREQLKKKKIGFLFT